MRLHINYIQWKLTLTYLILIAIVVVFIDTYLNISLNKYLIGPVRERLTKETLSVKNYLESLLPSDMAQEAANQLADKFGKEFEVRVTIVDTLGKVLGDTNLDGQALLQAENHADRPEIIQALHSSIGESIRYSATIKTRRLYIAMPILKGRHPVGVVRLSRPMTDIDRIAAKLRKILMFASCLGLLVALVLSYVISGAISKPIREMIDVTKKMATGDLSVKAYTRSRYEIQELASALNQMASQLKNRIEEITQEKTRLETILSGMSEGVMVVNRDKQIILVNPALKHIFRLSDSITGKIPLEVVRDIKLQEAVNQSLKTGQAITEEISLSWPSEKVLQVHVARLLTSGRVEGLVAVFHDITELRRLERVRSDFVANVSHELRTPLTSLVGYAETLLDSTLEDRESIRDFLETIHKHAIRMKAIIDDLLILSMIESGRAEMKFEPVFIEEVFNTAIHVLEPKARSKSITLEKSCPETPLLVSGDRDRLEQAVINLLDNAIKYTPEGGTVTLRAERTDGKIRIDVHDTGIGIPQEHIPRIFERFYRVDKDRSRELGGTGLGLSIVKHIVHAHKGEIMVESEIGKGSTFSIILPEASESLPTFLGTV